MGKERNTRNILLYLAAYAVFFLTLLVVLRPEIKSNLTGHGYMEALEEYKNILLEGERTNLEIALYSIEGITRAEAESKTGFTDIDHLRIEALLSAPTEENLKEGLITYIDRGRLRKGAAFLWPFRARRQLIYARSFGSWDLFLYFCSSIKDCLWPAPR